MSDHAPFLQQILDDPEDDAARLVYADWLEEQGDPRGEFIQVQCALARDDTKPSHRPKLRKRERTLYQKHWREWTADFKGICRKPVFRRGFLDEATFTLRDFVKHAPAFFARHPLRHATLSAGAKLMAKLAALPQLQRLSTLRLPQNGFDDVAIHELAKSEYVGNIQRLVLYHQLFGPNGMRDLSASKEFRSLTSLDLSLNSQIGPAITQILNASFLPQLTTLLLRTCFASNIGFREFCHHAPLKQLEHLDISGNFSESRAIMDSGAALLAGSRTFPSLRQLTLDSNRLTSTGLAQLAEARHFPKLKVLELRWNGIDDAGVIALAGSPLLAQLERIGLSGNQITRTGAEALGSSPHLTDRTQIMLSNNLIRSKRDIQFLQQRYGKSFGSL